MKRKKLYIVILLFVGILTSCKVGKSYVRPDLHLPDSKYSAMLAERAQRKFPQRSSSQETRNCASKVSDLLKASPP